MPSDPLVKSAPRRALLRLAGLGALLGVVGRRCTAQASDGDPILQGRRTTATARTTLTATVPARGPAFRVQSDNNIERGINAVGGAGGSSGSAGHGLIARGGDTIRGAAGGWGVETGGSPSGNRPAHGLQATGGTSSSGSGGSGLVAAGGESRTQVGGFGVIARGGDALGADAEAGPGLEAQGIGRPRPGTTAGVAVYAEGGGVPLASALYVAIVGVTNSDSPAVAGIVGVNSDPAGTGVHGESEGAGIGVRGDSQSGEGGHFESQTAAGVFGQSTDGRGLWGGADTGPGLTGESTSGEGILGESVDGVGLRGRSTSGVGGVFLTETAAQYAAEALGVPQGLGLLVNGTLVVHNGTKSAAVETSQGPTLVYCVASVAPMFEDHGTGRLVGGGARVELDPLFAETIEADDYYVFASPHAQETRGLAVVAQDRRGFTVREAGGGTGHYSFAYRVVARRRGWPAERRWVRAVSPELPATRPRPAPSLADRIASAPREQVRREEG